MSQRVMVFAKPPRPGQVKTRLAKDVGFELAAVLADAMLQDVWLMLESCEGVQPLLVTTEPAAFSFPTGPFWLQGEGSLGDRMERALQRALRTFTGPAIIVGSDAPCLTDRDLRSAMDALETAPSVLIPSTDGGYVLIGVRETSPEMFSGVQWSSPEALEQTRAALTRTVGAPVILPARYDLDELGDVERLMRDHELGTVVAPNMMDAITAHQVNFKRTS